MVLKEVEEEAAGQEEWAEAAKEVLVVLEGLDLAAIVFVLIAVSQHLIN